MANVGSAYISIYPSLDGFESKIKAALSGIDVSSIGDKLGNQIGGGIDGGISKASRSASGFSGKLSALAGVAGGVASEIAGRLFNAVANLGSEMVEASDSAQKFASTLGFAGIDDSTIQQLTASTQEYADQTVYDLADIRNATAQLAANGVNDYAALAEAAGNLNAVAGGNAETFKSVSMVMSQTAGSGRLMTENWNQLTDAIPGASGALQEAMRSAGAFEGNFRDAMEKGKVSADEFFAAVQKLGMQDVAVDAAKSTSTIEGSVGNLKAAVVGIGSEIISEMTPAITGGINVISGFLGDVKSAISGTFSDIASGVDVATAIQSNFGPMLEGLKGSIFSGIQGIAAQLPTLLPMILNGAMGLFMGLVQALPQILPQLVSGVANAISAIASYLPTLVPMILQAAVTLFLAIVQALPQVISSLLSALLGMIVSAASTIASGAGQFLSAAGQMLQGLIDGAAKGISDFMAKIGEIPGKIAEFFADAGSWLLDAGGQIIQGLINGINGAIAGVGEAIMSGVGGAVDSFKSFLGIASPSKLFRKFGEYTMEGFAIGIEDSSSAPVRAVKSAMADVRDLMPRSKYSDIVLSGMANTLHTPVNTTSQGAGIVQNFNTRVVRADEDLYSVVPIIYRNAAREARLMRV